jgi:hypothetical protein
MGTSESDVGAMEALENLAKDCRCSVDDEGGSRGRLAEDDHRTRSTEMAQN